MRNRLVLAVVAMCLMLATGCGGSLGSDDLSPEGECWSLTDTLRIEADIEDPGSYQLVFPITFKEEYNYQNIYLYVMVVSPSGKVTQAPYNYVLMNEYGEWYEKPKGDKITFELPLGRNIRLDEKGTYKFAACHYMRDENLCGISQAGMELRADK